jgi:hypothetical protein
MLYKILLTLLRSFVSKWNIIRESLNSFESFPQVVKAL